jgi:hypothetical protein
VASARDELASWAPHVLARMTWAHKAVTSQREALLLRVAVVEEEVAACTEAAAALTCTAVEQSAEAGQNMREESAAQIECARQRVTESRTEVEKLRSLTQRLQVEQLRTKAATN